MCAPQLFAVIPPYILGFFEEEVHIHVHVQYDLKWQCFLVNHIQCTLCIVLSV